MLAIFNTIITVFQKVTESMSSVLDRVDDANNIYNSIGNSHKKIGRLERLSNRNTERRYQIQWYDKVYTAASTTLSRITSGKTSRTLGVVVAGVGFALSLAAPPVAIALVATSLVGYTASVASAVIQKRNLEKTKDEAVALKRVVKSKSKSLNIAHKLNISQKMCDDIGLSSLSLPDEASSKKKSKLSKEELLKKTTDISVQKNENGKTSYAKSAMKAVRSSGIEWVGNIATATANLANPILLSMTIASTVGSYLSETNERKEVSNQKQDLKNAIGHFRGRRDVAGYNNLNELQHQSRKAKLDCMALEKLEHNDEFKTALKEKNAVLLKQMLTSAKLESISEISAVENSKELKDFHKKREASITKEVKENLSKDYKGLETRATAELPQGSSQKEILIVMKELAEKEATIKIDTDLGSKKSDLIENIHNEARLKDNNAALSPEEQNKKIEKFQSQDKQNFWQKTKALVLDVGSSLNFFKKESFEIEKPHELLTNKKLQDLAVHKEQVHASHELEHKKYKEKANDILSAQVSHMKSSLSAVLGTHSTTLTNFNQTPVSIKHNKSEGMPSH